ncbi:MAG: biotin/lipoyl-binding protein, partial [Pyrinomonadaceae bacterium]|nr:biotin/lipoyl-binding protein [Pyrinomonadaceae bacterium]
MSRPSFFNRKVEREVHGLKDIMVKVIDKAETREKTKDANGTNRSPVEAPVDDELAPTGAPTALPEAGSRPVETRDGSENATTRKPLYKRPVALVVAAIVLIVGATIGVHYWRYALSHESTDDAFIDGHIIQISPKVSAYVKKVYIDDNQQVKAGDLLVELDPRDYQTRLDQAKAALDAGLARQNEAKTNVSLTRATGAANVQQASATVSQARSGVESSRAAAASSQ